jgi:hypothetical protein
VGFESLQLQPGLFVWYCLCCGCYFVTSAQYLLLVVRYCSRSEAKHQKCKLVIRIFFDYDKHGEYTHEHVTTPALSAGPHFSSHALIFLTLELIFYLACVRNMLECVCCVQCAQGGILRVFSSFRIIAKMFRCQLEIVNLS